MLALVLCLLLGCLAVAGYKAGRNGHAAPFVAVALILPYLLAAAIALGTKDRVADAFGCALGADAFGTESEEPEGLASEDLEPEVQALAEQQGFAVDEVDCPDSLPAEVGAQVQCAVTMSDGEERKVDVTATKVKGGQVFFNVEETALLSDQNMDGIDDEEYRGEE
jgi:hypothetical protein